MAGSADGRFAGGRARRPFALPKRPRRVLLGLRELFRDGRIDLEPNDELVRQLLSIRWSVGSLSRIVIELKAKQRARGDGSPDLVDGLALAFAPGNPANFRDGTGARGMFSRVI